MNTIQNDITYRPNIVFWILCNKNDILITCGEKFVTNSFIYDLKFTNFLMDSEVLKIHDVPDISKQSVN